MKQESKPPVTFPVQSSNILPLFHKKNKATGNIHVASVCSLLNHSQHLTSAKTYSEGQVLAWHSQESHGRAARLGAQPFSDRGGRPRQDKLSCARGQCWNLRLGLVFTFGRVASQTLNSVSRQDGRAGFLDFFYYEIMQSRLQHCQFFCG